jgi:hypothetical protein
VLYQLAAKGLDICPVSSFRYHIQKDGLTAPQPQPLHAAASLIFPQLPQLQLVLPCSTPQCGLEAGHAGLQHLHPLGLGPALWGSLQAAGVQALTRPVMHEKKGCNSAVDKTNLIDYSQSFKKCESHLPPNSDIYSQASQHRQSLSDIGRHQIPTSRHGQSHTCCMTCSKSKSTGYRVYMGTFNSDGATWAPWAKRLVSFSLQK